MKEKKDWVLYGISIPREEKETLRKKLNILAAQEDLAIWKILEKAVENYRLQGERR
jgi:hypothetical protein